MKIIKLLNVKNITVFLFIAAGYFIIPFIFFFYLKFIKLINLMRPSKKVMHLSSLSKVMRLASPLPSKLQRKVILKRQQYFLIIYLRKGRMIKNLLCIITLAIFTLNAPSLLMEQAIAQR